MYNIKNIAKEIFVKRPIKDKNPNEKNKKKINLTNIFESFMQSNKVKKYMGIWE
jgi:hypothetical protein